MESLKENETHKFTWWYVKRTSKSIFCSNGHIWRPQNNRVLLICECKYRLLQNVNSVYSESPFCLKVLIPSANRWRNSAHCREHYVHTGMTYTCMQSSSIWFCCLIIIGCPISKNGPCFKKCVKFSCKEHARNDETKSNRKNKSKQNRVCPFRLATNASL